MTAEPQTDLSAPPRYRITGKEWLPVNGIAEPPGTEFNASGWPIWPLARIGQLEAVNEPGRRILAYANRMLNAYPVIDSPWDDVHGRIFLPEPGNDYRGTAVRVVAEADILPTMPQYRALAAFRESPFLPERRFPHRQVKVGDVIAVITWPDRLSRREFEPANPEAEQVWDYYEVNRDHPNLGPSPFCWFHRAIFLPALAGRRRAPEAA